MRLKKCKLVLRLHSPIHLEMLRQSQITATWYLEGVRQLRRNLTFWKPNAILCDCVSASNASRKCHTMQATTSTSNDAVGLQRWSWKGSLGFVRRLFNCLFVCLLLNGPSARFRPFEGQSMVESRWLQCLTAISQTGVTGSVVSCLVCSVEPT